MDLKEHFSQSKSNPHGVYFVFDKKNNLVYVGQSSLDKNSTSLWGLKDRINQHQTNSSSAKHFGTTIDDITQNYSFSYIIEKDKAKVIELEILFIKLFSRILKFNSNHIIDVFTD